MLLKNKKHKDVIYDFLDFLNSNSEDYILKGGTALMVGYNLDRFSEDIDLDGSKDGIGHIVDTFCKERNYSHRIAKDTATVKRYMINYGVNSKPLKVEISFRKKYIEKAEFDKFKGINIYNINSLAIMKANAYISRDRLRDLYDITFICNNYWEQLSDTVKLLLRETIRHKGIEQFDYLIHNQADELIDSDKLAENFLEMYDRLGLLADDKEIFKIRNNRVKKRCKRDDLIL